MRWVVGLCIAAGLAGSACNSDKVLAGRRALATEPAKAIALFQQAEAEKSPCFECQAYLGLAFEKTGDLVAARAAYEKAVALPEAAGRPEQVGYRLLDLYEKLFQTAPTPEARLELAQKAAGLEASLKTGRAWGNQFVADKLKKDLLAAPDAAKVNAVAKAIQALYLPVEVKRQLASDATEALRTLFVKKAGQAFRDKLATDLADKGQFDADASLVIASNRFKIPSKKEDEAYDPEADAFKGNLRKGACMPLREKVDELVARTAEAVGVKKPDKADLDVLFAKYFQYSRAGFTVYNGDRKAPAGQTYLCQIRVPLDDFVGELFRYAE